MNTLLTTAESVGATNPTTMRAVAINRYGAADELAVHDLPKPACGDHQVMIRVRAAGINPIDWRIRCGSLRWILPARFPLVLGFDVAGDIVELGTAARQRGWELGDAVMCFLDSRHGGGYAEYAVGSADLLARKPAGISFAEAAAVPLTALTALQALRDLGKIAAGHRVLINGGSGGVGTFAVQLAAALGAEVTTVASGSHGDFLRELGAHHVLDYTREDFTLPPRRYDIVFDAVAKSSYWKCRRVLQRGGCYITTVPSPGSLFFPLITWANGPRCRNILVRRRGEDLRTMARMIDDGKIRCMVEKIYSFNDAGAAHRASEAGHVRGKLVLTTDPHSSTSSSDR